MTCVTCPLLSAHIGILLMTQCRMSPFGDGVSCSMRSISPLSNTRANSSSNTSRGWRVSTLKTFLPSTGRADAELAEFAVAVPRHYSILAIDRVKRQRQAIDNRFNEPALRFGFRGLFLDFPRQAH